MGMRRMALAPLAMAARREESDAAEPSGASALDHSPPPNTTPWYRHGAGAACRAVVGGSGVGAVEGDLVPVESRGQPPGLPPAAASNVSVSIISALAPLVAGRTYE